MSSGLWSAFLRPVLWIVMDLVLGFGGFGVLDGWTVQYWIEQIRHHDCHNDSWQWFWMMMIPDWLIDWFCHWLVIIRLMINQWMTCFRLQLKPHEEDWWGKATIAITLSWCRVMWVSSAVGAWNFCGAIKNWGCHNKVRCPLLATSKKEGGSTRAKGQER